MNIDNILATINQYLLLKMYIYVQSTWLKSIFSHQMKPEGDNVNWIYKKFRVSQFRPGCWKVAGNSDRVD